MKKKLLHITLKYYIFFALAILLISAPAFYFITQWIYISDTNETLQLSKKEFFKYSLPYLNQTDIIVWNKMNWNVKIEPFKKDIKRDTIFNTQIPDSLEQEDEAYRVLMTPAFINNQPYTLLVRINMIESEDLVKSIVFVFLGIIILLLIGLFFITKRLSIKLWKPFNKSLEQIELFEIDKDRYLQEVNTNIDEFSRLDKSFNKLIKRNIAIYKSQQEFIENASHELQTPLAVFQVKLDALMQTSELTKVQVDIIEFLNQSVSRLSKLNKNLLFLSKLDHNQYSECETLMMKDIIQKHVDFFSNQTKSKNITFKTNIKSKVKIYANATLIDVLISNLLLNALRYNVQNGIIEVALYDQKLTIANTGLKMALDSTKIFERFSKIDPSSQGSGLGLAIVKKITEYYHWQLNYMWVDKFHIFEINFTK